MNLNKEFLLAVKWGTQIIPLTVLLEIYAIKLPFRADP